MINATYTQRIDFSVTTTVTYGVETSEAQAPQSLPAASAAPAVAAGAAPATNPTDSVTISPDSSRLARSADALFTALDGDQDGTITDQEFTDGARTLLREARGRHHRHHHHHGRDFRNEGGRFGGERWGGERAGGTRLASALSNLFTSVDGNADGGITKDELTSALAAATRPARPATTQTPTAASETPAVEAPVSQEPAPETAVSEQPVENAVDATTVGGNEPQVVGDPAFIVGQPVEETLAEAPVENPVAIAEPVVVAAEEPVAAVADAEPVEEAVAEEPAQDSNTSTPTSADTNAAQLNLLADYAELGRRAQNALFRLLDANRSNWSTSSSSDENSGIREERFAQKLASAFAKFDGNGDGSISRDEFSAAFGLNIAQPTTGTGEANSATESAPESATEAPAAEASPDAVVPENAVAEPVPAVSAPVEQAVEQPASVVGAPVEQPAEQPAAVQELVAGEEQPAIEEPVVAEEASAVAESAEPAVEQTPAAEEPAASESPVVLDNAGSGVLNTLADAAEHVRERRGGHHHNHGGHHSHGGGLGRLAHAAIALQRYHSHAGRFAA